MVIINPKRYIVTLIFCVMLLIAIPGFTQEQPIPDNNALAEDEVAQPDEATQISDTVEDFENVDPNAVQTTVSSGSSDIDLMEADDPPHRYDITANWGGWLQVTQMYCTDNWQTATILNFKAFMELLINPDISVYFRFKTYMYYFPNVPLDSEGEASYDDFNIYPDIDQLFFSGYFSGLNIRAGREFFLLGRGIVLASIGDGLELGYTLGETLSFDVFALYTGLNIWEEINPLKLQFQDMINSIAFTSPTNTILAGFNLEFPNAFVGITPYIYGLYKYDIDDPVQADEDDSDSTDVAQFMTYYAGLGFTGTIKDLVNINVEGVFQGGRVESISSDNELIVNKIIAYCVDALIQVLLVQDMKFSIDLQFDYSTGDSDSLGNSNTFMPFGAIDTGVVFRPSLRNLVLGRAGISINPLYMVDLFSNFLFSMRYAYYAKADVDDYLSSNFYTFTSEDEELGELLGHAVEIVLGWRILSDMSLQISMGWLFPGENAFAERDDTTIAIDENIFQANASIILFF